MLGGIIEYLDDFKLNFYYKQKGKNSPKLDGRMLYVTVAFNNEQVIEWQMKLLKKYEREMNYLVADNSDDNGASKRIERLCVRGGVKYIKLPPNPFSGSKSHGAALNWICKKVINRQCKYVVFLDHDCFPISRCNLREKLEYQNIYGLKQVRGERWYLWPGFAAFNLEKIDIRKLDFMPTSWGDTGSGCYETIYFQENETILKFATQDYKRITSNGECVQSSHIEMFDGEWIHLMNGSNWMGIENNDKMGILQELLRSVDKLEIK